MMTCAPLTVLEDLKVCNKEGLSKLCPLGIVPRKYEALLFYLEPRESGTRGHYFLVSLSTLSGPHMRLRDVLLL